MKFETKHIYDFDIKMWEKFYEDLKRLPIKFKSQIQHNNNNNNNIERIQCKCCGAIKNKNSICEYCGM
jgi:hypothetical protein